MWTGHTAARVKVGWSLDSGRGGLRVEVGWSLDSGRGALRVEVGWSLDSGRGGLRVEVGWSLDSGRGGLQVEVGWSLDSGRGGLRVEVGWSLDSGRGGRTALDVEAVGGWLEAARLCTGGWLEAGAARGWRRRQFVEAIAGRGAALPNRPARSEREGGARRGAVGQCLRVDRGYVGVWADQLRSRPALRAGGAVGWP
ncbi:hypothetical protein FJT64_023692 [Amphibalanus amphitrite]|uniref:Uncharacterized protein n=2 Tax=Amphibalanus amphitrite TaxID=1232801 RepID=A0A6A4WLC5_AMPAM|nr:hypothetical protein FJT64_023692 [Amphibalanus amphitrite]